LSSRPKPTTPSAVLAPALAALAALVLSACSSTGSGSDVAVATTPTLLNTATLRLPMQDYIPSAQQLSRLGRAQRILTAQCMARYGYGYRIPELPERPSEGGENGRRYGLTDPEAAASTGYGADEANQPAKPARPSMDAVETLVLSGSGKLDPKTLPKTQAEAEKSGRSDGEVNGKPVPVGGCTREGYLKLWMPAADSRDPMRVQDLDAEAYSRSRQDSRVVAATTAWTECMAKKGYHAKNPVSPQPELGLTPATFTSPEGVTAATADVGCKREVNLVGIWYSVESAYQNRLIEKNTELLRATGKQQDDALRLAAQLIAQAG